MSVFAKNYLNEDHILYAKGAPEKIKELSNPKTVPANFESVLEDYT